MLQNVTKFLDGLYKNKVAPSLIRVGIVVYIVMVNQGSAPQQIVDLFNNLFFRLFYLCLTALMTMVDPITALLLAGAFLFSLQANADNQSSMGLMNGQESFSEEAGNNVGPSTIVPYENDHPASKTMTESLDTPFTTESQFHDAQSNQLSEVSQEMGVKSLVQQNGPQGLDLPSGFDEVEYQFGFPLN